MKTRLIAAAIIILLSVGVCANNVTIFFQPDARIQYFGARGSYNSIYQLTGPLPYFGARGVHEEIYDGIELSLEWEAGQFTFITPRSLRGFTFYDLKLRPRLQLMIASEWWAGISVFNQLCTNRLGHYVFQPEFFIRHEW